MNVIKTIPKSYKNVDKPDTLDGLNSQFHPYCRIHHYSKNITVVIIIITTATTIIISQCDSAFLK